MTKEYVGQLTNLLARLISGRPVHGAQVECKDFFSGAAAYANGRIFMTLTPVGLAIKLPEKARTDLMGKGATPLRYFPKAPVKKEYAVLPRTVLDDAEAMQRLVKTSIEYVRSVPVTRKSAGRGRHPS